MSIQASCSCANCAQNAITWDMANLALLWTLFSHSGSILMHCGLPHRSCNCSALDLPGLLCCGLLWTALGPSPLRLP